MRERGTHIVATQFRRLWSDARVGREPPEKNVAQHAPSRQDDLAHILVILL